MNFDFIKTYENIKNIIREEGSLFIGYIMIFILWSYIIHSVFITYTIPYDKFYFITLLVYFFISFLFWYIKFNVVKYKKNSVNILLFPFENSVLNKNFEKKYEINNEIYKLFYNTINLYTTDKLSINIIKMNYKYDKFCDTELLKIFWNSSADILIRWKIINDGERLWIMPVITFTENFWNKRTSGIRYLTNCWNLISQIYHLNLIELDNTTIKENKKSLDLFSGYVSDLFIFVIKYIEYTDWKYINNTTYLEGYMEILNNSIGKFWGIYDIFIYTLLLRVYDDLHYHIDLKLEIFKKQKVLIRQYDNIALQSEYFYSILHQYWEILVKNKKYKEAKAAYKLSFKFEPTRHALLWFYNISKEENLNEQELENIVSMCEDFISINNHNIFRYWWYKIIWLIFLEQKKEKARAQEYFTQAIDILREAEYQIMYKDLIDVQIKEIETYIAATKL